MKIEKAESAKFLRKTSWMPWLPELSPDKLRLLNAIKERKRKDVILIVDNEANILNLLNAILSETYTPVLKNSSLGALQWIEEGNKPALIITEFNLPDFNGSSFLNYLRTSGLYKSVPIIILSELENIHDDLAQTSFGIAAIVKKPFDPILLQLHIKSIIYEYKHACAG